MLKYPRKINVKSLFFLLIAGVIFSVFLISQGALKTNLVHYSRTKGYYDMYGDKYSYCDDVPLFDNNNKKYILKKCSDGINWYAYFDEYGNQYELENSFVSEDGYFYYDETNMLYCDDNIISIGSIFYDNSGNKFSKAFEGIYFDKDGNPIHHGSKGDIHVYCFIFK